MKHSHFDNLLIGFFILVFILSIYLLTDQIDQVSSVKQANEIGHVVEIKNSVKKRQFNMATWHTINNLDSIQEDDIIFTGAQGSILVAFNDGSMLKIEGDSLIRLKEIKDSLGVVLEKGSMQVDNKDKMNIEINLKDNKLITLEGKSAFKFSQDSTKDSFSINSLSGKANIHSASGTTSINNGQVLNITKNNIKKTTFPLTLVVGEILNKTIFLEWTSIYPIENYNISISEKISSLNAKEFSISENALKIPWDSPEAHVIITFKDHNNIKQTFNRTIYSKKSELLNSSKIKKQTIMERVIDEFKRMINNSKNKP